MNDEEWKRNWKRRGGNFKLSMNILQILIIMMIILLTISMVWIYFNNNICEEACGEALSYQSHQKGNFFKEITQTDSLSCTCYYPDKTITKKIR